MLKKNIRRPANRNQPPSLPSDVPSRDACADWMRSGDVARPRSVIGPREAINIRRGNQEVQFSLGVSDSCSCKQRHYKVSGSTEWLGNLTEFNVVVAPQYLCVCVRALCLCVYLCLNRLKTATDAICIWFNFVHLFNEFIFSM